MSPALAQTRHANEVLNELTPREREVLDAIWEAGNGPGAAEQLGLSWHTIRTHTQSARSKLGVATTLEAIRIVREYGDRA